MKSCKDFKWLMEMESKIVIDAIKFVVLWLFGGWKIVAVIGRVNCNV